MDVDAHKTGRVGREAFVKLPVMGHSRTRQRFILRTVFFSKAYFRMYKGHINKLLFLFKIFWAMPQIDAT